MERLTGRIHSTRKISDNLLFLILRNNLTTIQCVLTNPQLIETISTYPLESIIKIIGTKTSAKVKSCTVKDYEIQVNEINIISLADNNLPVLINTDIESGQNVRLNNRWLDLRKDENQKIFKVQSLICRYFREYLDRDGFQEIHTPKLICTSSESGSEVFKVNYFDKEAYLAQSPQFYKQMAINSDIPRVYEIGPVFRAEMSNTYRHLTEFTGLDIEMRIEYQYMEIIDKLWGLLCYILDGLHEYHNLKYPSRPVLITYNDALEKINKDKLGTSEEKELGEYMLKEHDTDLFVVTEYPETDRPFYTKCEHGRTKSFDIIMCGNEILSGAQRENDYAILKEKTIKLGLENDVADYLESFRYGSYPHGGGGFGLERLTMFILGLNNIRSVSMFPRDPERLRP